MAEHDPISAVRIGHERGGQIIAVHVELRYSQPETPARAVEKVRAGKSVFVKRADAHHVLDALGITGIEQ